MIPKKIKICAIEYTVCQNKDNELSCANLDGEIRYAMQEIVLMSKYKQQYKEQVLCHEIVHGIFNAMGRTDLRTDETLVDGFSQILYQVLKENKLNFND